MLELFYRLGAQEVSLSLWCHRFFFPLTQDTKTTNFLPEGREAGIRVLLLCVLLETPDPTPLVVSGCLVLPYSQSPPSLSLWRCLDHRLYHTWWADSEAIFSWLEIYKKLKHPSWNYCPLSCLKLRLISYIWVGVVWVSNVCALSPLFSTQLHYWAQDGISVTKENPQLILYHHTRQLNSLEILKVLLFASLLKRFHFSKK